MDLHKSKTNKNDLEYYEKMDLIYFKIIRYFSGT